MEAAGGGGAAGGIALHDFSGQLGEQRVHFHAMRLRDSLFLWVGAAPALASLAVAMCSPRDSIPVAASLLGDPSDTASSCLAQRLGVHVSNRILRKQGQRRSPCPSELGQSPGSRGPWQRQPRGTPRFTLFWELEQHLRDSVGKHNLEVEF
ncbi:proteasome assembly chaperone 4 isoform X1 [Onychostruthus taczanowskii]|uniref:proteasome assembly chaperone 4 isoform X1 n=1 Tax=Onychostruthus taczanowskii TaxID=356909 RepID=UPI001B809C16|nr:proteasome assembly chaperone 4 isoform X1 [Onychostruthus taczanowskii]